MDDRESLSLQKNSGRISEETSRRIASLRYLLIVLVVFIHARFIVQADGVALNAYGTAGEWVQKPFEWLQDLWLRFFPLKNGFFCLFHYFFFTALVVVLGTGMGIALKKICPPVFKLLTGGR